MIKTALLTFVVAINVSSPEPQPITEPVKTMLECNNLAIQLSDKYEDIGCIAYGQDGVVFDFKKSGQKVTYITGYTRKPDIVIETRRR